MDFFHKFIHGLGEFYTFCCRYPLNTGTAIFHTDEVQHGEKKCHTSSRIIVSGCVVAVSRMAAAHNHTVSTFFKGTEDKHSVKYPYDLSHEKVSEGDRRLAEAMTMVADGPALAVLTTTIRPP